MTAEIKCSNCAAVCCGPAVKIPLTDKEADFLQEAGTKLQMIIPPLPGSINLLEQSDLTVSKVPANHGVYLLTKKCGLAKKKDGWIQCKAKNNPRRPKACNKFKEGGEICQLMRSDRGID